MSPRLIRLAPIAVLGLVPLAAPLLPPIPAAIALYPALGVLPGMALAGAIAGRGPHAPRWTLGLALAPLVTASAGALLLAAGVPAAAAARTIALAAGALWALAELLRRGPEPAAADDGPAPDLRFVLGWGGLLAVLVALPWLLNPFLLVRIDSWIHGGLVWEILGHGIPPEDPRFAGMPLHYVWFFNLHVALLTALGADPFVTMALFNVLNIAVCVALAYRIGLALWADRTAAAGAALLVTLGLNAGAWLLWPVRLARALTGDVRGWPEVRNQLAEIHWTDAQVIYSLPAPFAHMVSFVDKFTIGTALSYAWLMLLLWLWALLRWLDHGRREALAWAALSAAGMLFFHGVVGLSVIPVGLATLVLAWLLAFRVPGLPARGRLVAFAAATVLGAAIAAPYTRAISSGWSPEQGALAHRYLRPSLVMLWTLATSCAAAAWFARRPLVRLFREPRPGGRVLAGFAAGMAAFAAVVHLPLDNESKFAFQVFFPLALIGGAAFLPETRAFLARRGPLVGGLVLALVFLLAPALTLVGYALDPERRTRPELNPAPGEEALYAWMRASTPHDAVFVDHRGRDLIMVKGRRRLWVGTISGPDKAGFPAAEMAARRAVEADLYGPLATPSDDAAALARLGRPAYVLYRAADFPGARPWAALEGAPPFERAYDRDGFAVYRVRP